jgi:hypothetical protein
MRRSLKRVNNRFFQRGRDLQELGGSTDATFDVGPHPTYRPVLVPVDGSREVNVCCNICHSPNYITMQPSLPADTRNFWRVVSHCSLAIFTRCVSERAEWLAISIFIGYKAYASAKKTLYDDVHRHPRGAAD